MSDIDTLCRLVDHAVQLRITRNRLENELRNTRVELDHVLYKIEKQRQHMYTSLGAQHELIERTETGTLHLRSRALVGSPTPNGQDNPTATET